MLVPNAGSNSCESEKEGDAETREEESRDNAAALEQVLLADQGMHTITLRRFAILTGIDLYSFSWLLSLKYITSNQSI